MGRIGKKPRDKGDSIGFSFHHVILSLIESGLAIFHQSFSDREIEPDLFSALLTAFTLSKRFQDLDKTPAEYETFHIDDNVAKMCYGRYLAGIVVSDEEVDDVIMDRLEKFITVFEDEYEFLLKNWHGDRTFFDQEWTAVQLREFLFEEGAAYRLHTDAMALTMNARQIRLVLLIQRFAGEGNFSRDELTSIMVQKLQVTEEDIQEFLVDLETHGIIVST